MKTFHLIIICNEKPPEKVEVVQTVEWYKNHKEERKATLQACANNPGELEDTPNCINAEDADAAVQSARSGGIKVKPIKY